RNVPCHPPNGWTWVMATVTLASAVPMPAPVAIAVIVWLPTAGAVRVAVHAWRPLAGAWSVAATAAEVPIDTVTLAPSTTVPCTVIGEPVTNWALAAGEEMTRSAAGA